MKLRITLDAKYPSKDPLDLIDAQSKDYTVKESKGNSQGSEKDAHSKDYTVEELKRKGQGIEKDAHSKDAVGEELKLKGQGIEVCHKFVCITIMLINSVIHLADNCNRPYLMFASF
ncbi:uncharacterized protein LOC135687683 isoform X2 [Rhopilema esculentum]|uniref:uncharacterized protein LOC135687683 isoform X2 n=1 Tax=Rhopilema esculentum TaxID=499914 RepID=UPI0031D1B343